MLGLPSPRCPFGCYAIHNSMLRDSWGSLSSTTCSCRHEHRDAEDQDRAARLTDTLDLARHMSTTSDTDQDTRSLSTMSLPHPHKRIQAVQATDSVRIQRTQSGATSCHIIRVIFGCNLCEPAWNFRPHPKPCPPSLECASSALVLATYHPATRLMWPECHASVHGHGSQGCPVSARHVRESW
jgi:hypothetical protein